MNTFFAFAGATTLGLALSGCSLGHSASDDLKSNNPAVALQAQKVVDLQKQVDEQEKILNHQKDQADLEKKRFEALEQQLDGAKQNLKGVKRQART